jgi:release factor glutamine methyltransferase
MRQRATHKDGVDRLAAAGCVAADEEARDLVAHAPDAATLDAWVARREQGEPLAWITGRACFCGRDVYVEPGVYVPRVQTEELARRAADVLPPGGRAVDLCTGSGAIAVHVRAAVPSVCVVGVDVDAGAVACARRNGVPAIVADAGSVPLRSRVADVVTAVAPYVPSDAMQFLAADVRRHEPLVAVDGGTDGLDVVRPVVSEAARLVRPGGVLLLELGGDQDAALVPIVETAGFTTLDAWRDEHGELRGVACVARRV